MKKIILLIGLLLSSFAAQAIPIPWHVNSADLNGHFTYDVDFNLYSEVSLSETYFGDDYYSILTGSASGFTAQSDYAGDITTLVFSSPLTDAGGIIGFMGTTTCFVNCGEGLPINYLEGAVASKGASVPEPSIIALFAAGLLGLGFARRRKS